MQHRREDWHRLASYVVSARVHSGLDRRALAAATGVTERTLGKLETGQRVSPETLAAVERALGWRPDSARLVLTGGEPVPAGEGKSPGYEDPALRHLWQTPGLTEEQKRGLIALAIGMRSASGAG